MSEGLQCPRCGCRHLVEPDGSPTTARTPAWKVTKTEHQRGYIRRLRVCRYCGKRIHTREVIEKADELDTGNLKLETGEE